MHGIIIIVVWLQISQKGLFKDIEQWVRDQRRFGDLYTLTDASEHQEIVMLIDKTWDRRFVGHGKDALNLKHTQLKVNQQIRGLFGWVCFALVLFVDFVC